MSTVLVTGGAGFIGSHVVDALIHEGYRIIVVDDLSSGREENLNPQARFYRRNLCHSALREIFTQNKIEWINHHAAQIDVRTSVTNPQKDVRINLLGLLNLLENALRYRVKGVVFASSGGVVYGEPKKLPVREDAPKGPLSPYGINKLSSEYYLYYYYRVHSLPYIALRYGNVYGPRQDPHGEAGVVAIFTGAMLSGKTPTIFGDGEQVRDFIYVEDVAQANLLALQHLTKLSSPSSLDDQAYNIGTGSGTSVSELSSHLKRLTGFRKEVNYGPERPGELRKIYLNVAKAAHGLGWQPTTHLEDGLRRTVAYFQR